MNLKTMAVGAVIGVVTGAILALRKRSDMSGGDIDRLIDRTKLSPRLSALLAVAEKAAKDIVGMRENDAKRLMTSQGVEPRLAWRSEWPKGFPYALTADLRIGRVNYTTSGGVVTKAYVA